MNHFRFLSVVFVFISIIISSCNKEKTITGISNSPGSVRHPDTSVTMTWILSFEKYKGLYTGCGSIPIPNLDTLGDYDFEVKFMVPYDQYLLTFRADSSVILTWHGDFLHQYKYSLTTDTLYLVAEKDIFRFPVSQNSDQLILMSPVIYSPPGVCDCEYGFNRAIWAIKKE